LLVEALDELYSGVPAVGAADIQRTFATSYEATAAALLVVPLVLTLVLEPIFFVLADRMPRRRFVVGGLAAMAVTAFASALAPSAWTLAIIVSFAYVAMGTGVALAQATLADAHPDDRDRVMTRWTLMGVLGDLLAPAMFALLGALALGWRSAYAICGVLITAVTIALATRTFPAPQREPEEDEPGVLTAIVDALKAPGLIAWLLAGWLCDLLDEILVIFAAIRLRDDFGADVSTRSLALGAIVAGGAFGLVIADRLLKRVASLKLLGLSAAACLACYLAWLAATTIPVAIGTLFLVGLTASPLYPIVAARTYDALPGRSGTVHAAGHITTPLSLALPWLLGWIADRAGALAALAVLAIAPIGIGLIALRSSHLSVRKLPEPPAKA
jgi:MFS family permease